MSDKSKYEILADIQAELNVPKDRYNKFGKFNYRSYEDIVEAVKPLCMKHRCTLATEDEIVDIGGWHYIKATAVLTFWDSGENICARAYAREAESKSGSDVSQLTGMASTYARKYALCGLFSIDGQDDADAMDNTPQKPNKRVSGQKKQSPKAEFWDMLQKSAEKMGLDPMKGAEAMKSWSDYADSDAFFTVMVGSMKNDEMGTMARMFPEIKEV